MLHFLAAWGADKRRRAEAVNVFAELTAAAGVAEPVTALPIGLQVEAQWSGPRERENAD